MKIFESVINKTPLFLIEYENKGYTNTEYCKYSCKRFI